MQPQDLVDGEDRATRGGSREFASPGLPLRIHVCARGARSRDSPADSPCDDRASTGKTGPPVGRARIYGPLMAVPSPPDTRARKSRLLGLRRPVEDPYGNPLPDPFVNPLR